MRLTLALVSLAVGVLMPRLNGAETSANAPTSAEDRIIYPGASSGNASPSLPAASSTRGLTTMLGVIALAGAGGWLLWKKRNEGTIRRDGRLLAIDETRPLGNRQYLVVASYEGRKFLLGVCPGRIDLLSPLEGTSRREPPSAS